MGQGEGLSPLGPRASPCLSAPANIGYDAALADPHRIAGRSAHERSAVARRSHRMPVFHLSPFAQAQATLPVPFLPGRR